MDQCVHDCMIELAQAEMASQRAASHNASASNAPQASQSSEIAFPSSDRGEEPSTPRPAQREQLTLEDQVIKQQYLVRPWGSDKSINLRDLNPSDMDKLISIKGLVI